VLQRPIAETNRERWNALAKANVEYSRPFLDLTQEVAAKHVYRHGVLESVEGQRVLCLAGGGGQDSAAFGLLGADVTVFDLSDIQLERDRQAAIHHGLQVDTIQGDMRNLSVFGDDTFDVVWQPYSINFVPSVEPVFREVARLLRSGGTYFLQFANPFVMAVDDQAWKGDAYALGRPYLDGEDVSQYFPHWDVTQPDSTQVKLESPHEYRHTLSTVMNTLVDEGFVFLGLWEWKIIEQDPQPGSWAHFTQIAPPWFSSFWRLRDT
jgi:ubiquinone/menaquinone biosynthesis C-methylase UbiE